MPAPANLIGQHQQNGRLKVIDEAEKKYGKRHWLCECDCGSGKPVFVSSSGFITEHTRSCGCLVEEGTGGGFKSSKALKEHKAKAKQTDADGREWYAPRIAARQVRVSRTTLANWQPFCPWLGRGIETQQREGGYDRLITSYLKTDLDDIRTAMAHTTGAPKIEGKVYVDDARKQLGVSIRTLYRLMQAKGIEPESISGKSSDGRGRFFSYVPQSFVEECLVPANKMTVKQTAAALGIRPVTVHQRISRKKLNAHSGPIGGNREGLLLFREEVEDSPRKVQPCGSMTILPKAEQSQRAGKKYGPAKKPPVDPLPRVITVGFEGPAYRQMVDAAHPPQQTEERKRSNHDRDQFAYDQRKAGKSLADIRIEAAARKEWAEFSDDRHVWQSIDNFRKRLSLPRLILADSK